MGYIEGYAQALYTPADGGEVQLSKELLLVDKENVPWQSRPSGNPEAPWSRLFMFSVEAAGQIEGVGWCAAILRADAFVIICSTDICPLFASVILNCRESSDSISIHVIVYL